MRTSILFLGILLTLTLPAMAERFVSCHDGDTCTLDTGLRVRLAGIDAPEIGQPFAEASRDYLTLQLIGRDAILQCTGWSYRRRTCDVFVNGLDVQKELVGWGLAYDYPQYSGGQYQNAQAFAQRMHRGVWMVSGGGIRPWNYRQFKEKTLTKKVLK